MNSALRVLHVNWRDPWHPRAGGAEVLSLRVFERLAQAGWHVEWFSSAYPGAVAEEVRDGIHYVRAGNQRSVHLAAYRRYRGNRNFDVVLEQINTVPFYAMTYGLPHVAWFQQLAREVWFYEAPKALQQIGYRLEPFYLAPFRNSPIITISESTRTSLREIGFRGRIETFPMASDEEPEIAVPQKHAAHDIAVVGRLAPSKRIEESIRSAAILRDNNWRGTLHIVGAGSAEYEAKLRALCSQLALEVQVHFHGRVTHSKRSEILRGATVLWMTSVREGWGLVVTEAAAKGTPAIVYDVPGLRDAVQNGVTGLVTPADPQSLAAATLNYFAGTVNFADAALRNARRLSWDATARVFAEKLTLLIPAAK